MIVDNFLVVAGAVSATGAISGQSLAGSGNIISTNTIDLSQQRDIGQGNDLLKLRAQVMAAVTGATSVEFQAITADDAALATNVTVIGSTGPVPVASLGQGARLVAELGPRIGSRGQRYMGARFVIAGTAATGAVFADFGDGYQDGQKAYPGGFTVL